MLFSAFCRTSLASLYCYNTAIHRWITYCRMRMRINAIIVVIKPYKTVEQIKRLFGGEADSLWSTEPCTLAWLGKYDESMCDGGDACCRYVTVATCYYITVFLSLSCNWGNITTRLALSLTVISRFINNSWLTVSDYLCILTLTLRTRNNQRQQISNDKCLYSTIVRHTTTTT